MLSNKDGRHAWRPFQIIHPVLYVSLVNTLTSRWVDIENRFAKFAGSSDINCCSIPLQSTARRKDKAIQIMNWWREIEQESPNLALEFNLTYHVDVADCYATV